MAWGSSSVSSATTGRSRCMTSSRSRTRSQSDSLRCHSTGTDVLSVPDAVASVLADIRPCPVERVALLDALGRVLAATVTAPITLPAWDNSAMDGYAVRAEDVATA